MSSYPIGPGGGHYWARRWEAVVPEPRKPTARTASVERALEAEEYAAPGNRAMLLQAASIFALIYLGDQLGRIANALNRRHR
jgi:hypothetical protein